MTEIHQAECRRRSNRMLTSDVSGVYIIYGSKRRLGRKCLGAELAKEKYIRHIRDGGSGGG